MLALAFFLGFDVGPFMHQVADIYPGLLTEAGVYTTTAFASFSALSLFSKRRSYLFLGGIIMTMIQAMTVYSLIAWFSGGGLGLGYIMVSLLLTCMWVIYDT